MKKLFAAVMLLIITATASTSHAATEIKLAILAPEGSTWHKVMTAWDN